MRVKSISAEGISRPEAKAGIIRRGVSPRAEMMRGQDKKKIKEIDNIAGEERRGRDVEEEYGGGLCAGEQGRSPARDTMHRA